jgi:hypothetical protein
LLIPSLFIIWGSTNHYDNNSWTGNHTVTQSSFATPCSELDANTMPFDSGFMPVNTSATSDNSSIQMIPSVSFQVMNTSAPMWFYCKQTGYGSFLFRFQNKAIWLINHNVACSHCEQGMVFAINPTASKTFAAFQV